MSDLLETLKRVVLTLAKTTDDADELLYLPCPSEFGLPDICPEQVKVEVGDCTACWQAAIEWAEREEGLGLKLHVKNQTSHTMQFCCGEKEYVLQPDEETTIEVKDEDCMYLDQAAIEQAEKGEA